MAGNTPWVGDGDNKLYLQSGQFSATMKTSVAVGTVDANPTGIAWDGTNSPWCGFESDKLYLQSGQFSGTLKTSRGTGTTSPRAVSNTAALHSPWCDDSPNKIYLLRERRFSPVRVARPRHHTFLREKRFRWDGTNTPW